MRKHGYKCNLETQPNINQEVEAYKKGIVKDPGFHHWQDGK